MQSHTMLLIFLVSSVGVLVRAKFAYERGSCDILISSAIREMFKNEMRALVDPSLRYSNRKRMRYDLYTRNNPDKRQVLKAGDRELLRGSYFNAKWPVRFSIHGWTGKSTSCSNAAVKDAYLAVGNFNVIIVDWSAHSLDFSYGRLSRQLPAIAAQLVEFVRFLHREAGVAYESMYLVGHSAGAHIAGLAGKLLAPQRFGVIYALDPAGLTQRALGEKHRLAPGDAHYIESIHTDITLLGNPSPALGHAAFFVNWGLGQPHCPNATAAEFDFACDHFAALYYFAESVRNPKMFGALQCRQSSNKNDNNSSSDSNSSNSGNSLDRQSCGCVDVAGAGVGAPAAGECTAVAFMGGEPAVPKNGTYYLSTQPVQPFGWGEIVRIRPAAPPNFLQSSFLSSNIFESMLFGA